MRRATGGSGRRRKAMKRSDIANQRLSNQHISQPRFREPAKVVEWLGAIQAQDYASAKWSLGLRLHGASDDDISANSARSSGAVGLRASWDRALSRFITLLYP